MLMADIKQKKSRISFTHWDRGETVHAEAFTVNWDFAFAVWAVIKSVHR